MTINIWNNIHYQIRPNGGIVSDLGFWQDDSLWQYSWHIASKWGTSAPASEGLGRPEARILVAKFLGGRKRGL